MEDEQLERSWQKRMEKKLNNKKMKEKASVSENRMGTMPVGKLMLSMGLPMIVSILFRIHTI